MKKRIALHFAPVGVAMALTGMGTVANASGFAIIEQSASQQGNAFAGGAAIGEDATTIFFNPAGMTRLPSGNQIILGGHVIDSKAKLTNDGSVSYLGGPLTGGDADGGTTGFVPNFYWATDLMHGARFGIGVNAPYGLTTKYDEDWVGRYHAIESTLQSLNINPAIAFPMNDQWSLGLGMDIMFMNARLTNDLNYNVICAGSGGLCSGASAPYADGRSEVDGSGFGFGYNLGLLYEPSDRTRVGVAYRSAISQTLNGTAKFDAPANFSADFAYPAFQETDASATLDLPESTSVSIYHDISSSWAIMADWTWTRWSRFKELTYEFANPYQPSATTEENWKNTNRIALGANYRVNSKWLLRMGAAFDNTPIPSDENRTPRIPDNDRAWASVGFNWKASKSMALDLAYSHLFVPDTHINDAQSTGGVLIGDYDSNVNILSAQLVWDF
jgi:long-chain fatty acid transport protein